MFGERDDGVLSSYGDLCLRTAETASAIYEVDEIRELTCSEPCCALTETVLFLWIFWQVLLVFLLCVYRFKGASISWFRVIHVCIRIFN